MHKKASKSGALVCPLMLLFLSSCALLNTEYARRGEVSPEQTHIAAGEYKKALDLYAAKYSIENPELRNEYLNSGIQVRNAADRAFGRGDFAKAGNIYHLLIKAGITEKDFSGSLPFDRGYLETQIKACSKNLTELGLTKYREQKLEEAISVWEKVLTFDRGNSSVITAIETANRQLQILKNIK